MPPAKPKKSKQKPEQPKPERTFVINARYVATRRYFIKADSPQQALALFGHGEHGIPETPEIECEWSIGDPVEWTTEMAKERGAKLLAEWEKRQHH